MKAFIISQRVCEGPIGFVHGAFHTIYRILVREANNLVITVDGERVYAWENFKFNKNSCKIIKKIILPPSYVTRVRRRAKEELLLKKTTEEIFAKELAKPPKTR